MVRQPLIRFRYAIQKAAAAGVKHELASAPTPVALSASKKIPAPAGVTRTSQRMEKPIPRAPITQDEMDAIMLGGAL